MNHRGAQHTRDVPRLTWRSFKAPKWPVAVIVAVFASLGVFFLYQSFAANPNLPGDIDGNNKVDLTDLSQLLSKWNTASTTHDLNGDGMVSLQDLSILLSNWNKTYTPTPTPTPPPTPTPTPPNNGSFVGPLKVSSDNRYFVDQNGKQFLYAGDTAWSLLTFLSVNNAKQYIDLRKAQGFNVILTNIVFNTRLATGPHGTPFVGGHMNQPIESYFVALDQIIAYAAPQNMVLHIGGLWIGSNGGYWGGTLPPTNELQYYGNYIGNRYKDYKNIIWFIGGDDDSTRNFSSIQTLGNALNNADPNHMITFHSWLKAPNAKAESWLDFNSFQWNSNSPPYSYDEVREHTDWTPTKPVLDIEPAYEPNACCGDDRSTSEQENRRNGWWAVLSKSVGVVYGGLEATWRVGYKGDTLDLAAINRNGARHTANIRKILEPLNWHLLQPDWSNQTVTGGRGTYGNTNYVTAGRASDGSLIVAYTPQAGTLTVNLTRLSGAASAQWYDPASGNAVGGPTTVSNSGSQSFNTPGNNAGGNQDWVLIIKRP